MQLFQRDTGSTSVSEKGHHQKDILYVTWDKKHKESLLKWEYQAACSQQDPRSCSNSTNCSQVTAHCSRPWDQTSSFLTWGTASCGGKANCNQQHNWNLDRKKLIGKVKLTKLDKWLQHSPFSALGAVQQRSPVPQPFPGLCWVFARCSLGGMPSTWVTSSSSWPPGHPNHTEPARAAQPHTQPWLHSRSLVLSRFPCGSLLISSLIATALQSRLFTMSLSHTGSHTPRAEQNAAAARRLSENK